MIIISAKNIQELTITDSNLASNIYTKLENTIILNGLPNETYSANSTIIQYRVNAQQNNINIASGRILETTGTTLIIKTLTGKFVDNSNYVISVGGIVKNTTNFSITHHVYTSQSGKSNLTVGGKYNIKHHVYRGPIAVKSIGEFNSKIYSETIGNSKIYRIL